MTNRVERNHIERCSNYLKTLLRRRDDFVDWLWQGRHLYRRYPLTALYEDLNSATSECDSFHQFALIVREFKQRHFLRIGGRDLLGWADLRETTAQLSDLACVTLQTGMERLHRNPHWWTRGEDISGWKSVRATHQMVVLGLGKLGGEELNYVSDIDLCFMRQMREREKAVPRRSLQLINKFFQYLASLLSDPIDGDRVFLVDLRLRPGGKDGELVPEVSAAADYYLNHGRAWERQMLLKARPVAGDRNLGSAFLQEIRPFVFRRFLDFQALDELRDMKVRIIAETNRLSRNQPFDVKLGRGGIREIEFIVQSLQLVYGGRYPQLDEANTLRCLDKLGDFGLLPRQVVADLIESYVFLRRVEHWIQLDQNRRTQKLPQSPLARQRLALALGFEGDDVRLLETLNRYCDTVHGHFQDLFHSSEPTLSPEDPTEKAMKTEIHEPPESFELLEGEEFAGLKHVLGLFPHEMKRVIVAELSRFHGRDREHVTQKVRARLESYLEKVRRRPGLLTMFRENGQWLQLVCRGVARSEMVASLLTHQPSLVEGVMTQLGQLRRSEEWRKNAELILAKSLDFEEVMEWIRRLKNERMLMLALADLQAYLSQADLEEELSQLADFVIKHTYQQILNYRGEGRDLPLAILALGKLGSREMNYLSDLDIMFVYDPREGESPDQIPIRVVRLIQRLNRMLSTPLQEGPGYIIDTRIRPTGNYGPLIATRKSWIEYYYNHADLWEIQALLRMRPIVGNKRLCAWIRAAAREICLQSRKEQKVWPRLCHLRKRMEEERGNEKQGWLDLKVGYGGLADLEFLVQGVQLIHGKENPWLVQNSIRKALPQVLDFAGFSKYRCEDLLAIFYAFRALEHRLHLHLNLSTSKLRESQFHSLVELGLWPPSERYDRFETWDDVQAARRRVRRAWEEMCSRVDQQATSGNNP